MNRSLLYFSYSDEIKKKLSEVPTVNLGLRCSLIFLAWIKVSLLFYMHFAIFVYYYVFYQYPTFYAAYFHILLGSGLISSLVTLYAIGFMSEYFLFYAIIAENFFALNFFNINFYLLAIGLNVFGYDRMKAQINFLHLFLIAIFFTFFGCAFGCVKVYKQVRRRNKWFEENTLFWPTGQTQMPMNRSEGQAVIQRVNQILPQYPTYPYTSNPEMVPQTAYYQ